MGSVTTISGDARLSTTCTQPPLPGFRIEMNLGGTRGFSFRGVYCARPHGGRVRQRGGVGRAHPGRSSWFRIKRSG